MEILSSFLEKINKEKLSDFENRTCKILSRIFQKINTEEVSNESFIEESLGLDVFIKQKNNTGVIHFSITKDSLHINSQNFDIYAYPEISDSKLVALLEAVFKGEYVTKFSYSKKGYVIKKEFKFDSSLLKGFNYNQRVGLGLLIRKIYKEDIVKGKNLIK